MDHKQIKAFVDKYWSKAVLPALCDYVRIPSVSINYDKDWKKHGFIHKALQLVANWSKKQGIANLQTKILQLPGLAPVLYIDVPKHGDCSSASTVLFTGHLDKMPADPKSWAKGLGPWQPIIKGDKLFGRGVADNGFAVFAYMAALQALREQNIAYNRCVFFIETAEESGSPGFENYLRKYGKLFGKVGLVVNLDTACDDHEHLWCSYSTRGITEGVLSVKVADTIKHSGVVTGVMPTPLMIVRELLDRVEDKKTGKILLPALHANISAKTKQRAKETAKIVGNHIVAEFGLLKGVRPLTQKIDQMILNSSWQPTMCVIGISGLPEIGQAYSAVHPCVDVALSFRLPSGIDPDKVNAVLRKTFETKPPYGAHVTYIPSKGAYGWSQAASVAWFEQAVDEASRHYFGKPCLYKLLGGSVGILYDLQKVYPQALFLVGGLLGYKSNEHGPNETLHMNVAKKITASLAEVLGAYAERV